MNSSPKTRNSRQTGQAQAPNQAARKKGLTMTPLFTRPGVDPFDEIEWEKRRAVIKNDKGEVVFESNEIEVPKAWSMLATNIVASKYFYGAHGMDIQEKSLRQLVHRVARTIADWGTRDGYFATTADAETFYRELSYICANQYGAFNSPVWFNVGLHQVYGLSSANKSCYYWNPDAAKIERTSDSYKHPQSSACFIQSVADSMEDIMRLAGSEAMLFKYGSGTGTDLSTLRSSREKLSGGGVPSGPLSFMRVFDQVAAVIKSGGKTRRAAKMQSLKVDHPDIVEFIQCKVNEEKKARALIKAGYDGSFNGEAYSSVMFQNANLSVRVSDEFMKAVDAGTVWHTRAVTTGDIVDVLEARTVMQSAAEAAHFCGDPGLQYDTTINRWHTCSASGRINASNPCSEYMFMDNSACNLASINLTKFSDAQHVFDVQRFQHVVRILIIAQDILVDNGSYPTQEIAENSHLFRPLGLGYANLGALIMSLGKPYDSDEGRAFAGAVTALLTSYAYTASAEIAATRGPFEEYAKNSASMMAVLGMHRDALIRVKHDQWISPLTREAHQAWDNAIEAGQRFGFRNAQVTVLAPTGTIGFMMDCDTTGVEPDIALVKYKQMADGGLFKIINQTLPIALKRLGYTNEQITAILAHVNEHDTIEEAPGLSPEHLKVFDCAFKPKKGSRFIDYHAHLKMMAAVQPFLSGAISKTINMPATATAKDVFQVFMDGWKLGLKAVAIYRDGSKGIQPVTTSRAGDAATAPEGAESIAASPKPFRHRMPLTRQSITHKFEVGGHQGYLTVGLYEDGTPGELFITMAKEGSTVGGIMDAFGTAISMCLQYGVPLSTLIEKFCHSRFEPSGFTKNPEIPYAKSLVDYIFRWLDLTFPDGRNQTMRLLRPSHDLAESKPEVAAAAAMPTNAVATPSEVNAPAQFKDMQADAPPCDKCGAITVRNGACYRCFNCGNSMGCS
ncbi:MAG: vitamin B12-dependent ribonucleotide reductase [Verrucomicrobia bacterium]|nr:vitamin B12-dependent ribonucleotide reductase [Verrucomicrobiota bacterium]MBU1735720.1 vitamin B12-dependent ribonucleotide reductase [Verrucomicrobiota bacterium]MBU1857570.1 vitamin B12-dependent ribonucleotide reductase [Verrucomicrobiota bacterium]